MSKRLLVLDDEALIAWGIADEMEDLGWSVAKVVGTSAAALDVIAEGAVDAAVLDFNLRGETSEVVAHAMIDKGMPFVFVSGAITETFAKFNNAVEVLTKPVDYQRLNDILTRLCSPADGAS